MAKHNEGPVGFSGGVPSAAKIEEHRTRIRHHIEQVATHRDRLWKTIQKSEATLMLRKKGFNKQLASAKGEKATRRLIAKIQTIDASLQDLADVRRSEGKLK